MALEEVPDAEQGDFGSERSSDFVPSICFYFFEFSSLPAQERLWSSVFQAVTPRTAGFNTADLTLLSETGQMLMIILMLIGDRRDRLPGNEDNNDRGSFFVCGFRISEKTNRHNCVGEGFQMMQ